MKNQIKEKQLQKLAKAPRAAAISRKSQANYAALRDEFLSDARNYFVFEDDVAMRKANTIIEEHVMLNKADSIIEDDVVMQLSPSLTIKDVVLPKADYIVTEDHIMLRASARGTTFTLPVIPVKEKEGDQPMAIVSYYPRNFMGEGATIGLARGYKTKDGKWEKVRLVDAQGFTIIEDILRSAEFSGKGGDIDVSVQGKILSLRDFDIVCALLEKGMFDELHAFMEGN